jgi:hypothetical protein
MLRFGCTLKALSPRQEMKKMLKRMLSLIEDYYKN